jgi:hypothetical protein
MMVAMTLSSSRHASLVVEVVLSILRHAKLLTR